MTQKELKKMGPGAKCLIWINEKLTVRGTVTRVFSDAIYVNSGQAKVLGFNFQYRFDPYEARYSTELPTMERPLTVLLRKENGSLTKKSEEVAVPFQLTSIDSNAYKSF